MLVTDCLYWLAGSAVGVPERCGVGEHEVGPQEDQDRLRALGLFDEASDAALGRRITDEIDAAVVWAEASPFPDREEVEDGVYSG